MMKNGEFVKVVALFLSSELNSGQDRGEVGGAVVFSFHFTVLLV